MLDTRTEIQKACQFFSCQHNSVSKKDALHYIGVLLCGIKGSGLGGGGGGGGAWGEITGTLSDQTDLQAALDALQTSINTKASSTPQLYNLAYSASLTPDASLYAHRGIVRVTGLNGALTINPPTNPVDGKIITFWMTAVSADRALTFNAAFVFPDEYSPVNPVTITSGQKRSFSIIYDATLTQWEVISNLGDYT